MAKGWKYIIPLLLLSLFFWLYSSQGSKAEWKNFGVLDEQVWELSPEAGSEIQKLLTSLTESPKKMEELTLSSELTQVKGPVVMRLWKSGRTLAEAWEDEGTWGDNLSQILLSFPSSDFFGATSLEIQFCHDFQDIDWKDADSLKELDRRAGSLGLELYYGGVLKRYSANELCISNYTFKSARDRFLKSQGQDPRATMRKEFKARSFRSLGYLVSLGNSLRATNLFRANQLLQPKQSRVDVEQLISGLVQSFNTSIKASRRLPYLFYPVSNKVSYRREVVVRQSLGLWALARLSRIRPQYTSLLEACMPETLRYYYSTDGEKGFITPDGRRDYRAIGEVSLMAMALLEGPLKGRYPAIEDSFLRTTDQQWNEDGSFYCFVGSDDYRRGIEYYPGETLLYWAHLYRENPDPERLRRFMKSFEFYKNYHLKERRRAAFVPWHTQACAVMWESTKDPKLADFVFEMNDWLADFSLWERAPDPDLRGAIWDPDRPEHGGVPHVSSTGVYLEGYAQAYKLAKALGDKERMEKYRSVIQRGIYSLRQHQYAGTDDLYFLSEPDRARGMLRGQLNKQLVRIDNNSHSLLALMALSEIFEDSDYEFGND